MEIEEKQQAIFYFVGGQGRIVRISYIRTDRNTYIYLFFFLRE